MKTQKGYFRLTLAVSILAGIILPLALGIKDALLLGYLPAFVCFAYALVRFITIFLIRPGLKIMGSRRNGLTVVKLELLRKDSE